MPFTAARDAGNVAPARAGRSGRSSAGLALPPFQAATCFPASRAGRLTLGEGPPRPAPPICARYARARPAAFFALYEMGGRNHSEAFFVPFMEIKPHTPVPGMGAADFADPPLPIVRPPHGPPRSASKLRTCAPLAGPSGRNGYTGHRGAGVLSAQEFAMGSDCEASADLRTIARARDPSMPSKRGGKHRHGSGVGEEKGDLESAICQ
jgi:hypothetical protein